jgi:hypothetical protein
LCEVTQCEACAAACVFGVELGCLAEVLGRLLRVPVHHQNFARESQHAGVVLYLVEDRLQFFERLGRLAASYVTSDQ